MSDYPKHLYVAEVKFARVNLLEDDTIFRDNVSRLGLYARVLFVTVIKIRSNLL